MVALIAVPVRFWYRPAYEAEYVGLDPNLTYADPVGDGSTAGLISSSHTSMQIEALPGSQPTVDLATSPLAFRSNVDVRILDAGDAATPLRIGLWSPATRAGYFLDFAPSPNPLITADYVVHGQGLKSLAGGSVVLRQMAGTYSVGDPIHLTFDLDKERRTLQTSITTRASFPFAGNALTLGSASGPYDEADGGPFPVTANSTYIFGGTVRRVLGSGPCAVGLIWYDGQRKQLPLANWWMTPTAAGWSQVRLRAAVPSQAHSAAILLAAGPASIYQFGSVYANASGASVDSAVNGNFVDGTHGWIHPTLPAQSLELLRPTPITAVYSVDSSQAPDLFRAFRPSLTITAAAGSRPMVTEISEFSLLLPSQPTAGAELVDQTNDPHARIAVLGLAALGCLVGLAAIVRRRARNRLRRHKVTLSLTAVSATTAGMGLLLYIALNVYLFHIGTPTFDSYAPRIWSYIAANYSPMYLYHWTLFVPAAASQGGVPWHEAVFPYGPTKVYYYYALGEIQKWLLSPTGTTTIAAFSFEILIKLTNVAFVLADTILVWALLRKGRSLFAHRAAWIATFFACTPATVFIASVWGATEAVSIFFVLLSILLFERSQLGLSWFVLALAAFTRPQMFVVALLLGVIYAKLQPAARTVRSLTWATIATFLVLAPLLVAISPSMPIDYVRHVLDFSVGTAQADPNYLGASPGYYSIWTLPASFISGESGTGRMWFPKTLPLAHSLSYASLSAYLSSGFLVLVLAAILLSPRRNLMQGRYLGWVAFGTFGWLFLSTGLVSRYFLYGLLLTLVAAPIFSH